MKERPIHPTNILLSSSCHSFDTLPSCLHCCPNILPNTFCCYLLSPHCPHVFPIIPMPFMLSPRMFGMDPSFPNVVPIIPRIMSIIPECGSHRSQDYVHHSPTIPLHVSTIDCSPFHVVVGMLRSMDETSPNQMSPSQT